MPARGHLARGKARRAAETFMAAAADGDSITIEAAAERFGLSLGAVRTALWELRKRQQETSHELRAIVPA